MKASIYLLLMMIALMGLVGWSGHGQSPKATAATWEYKIVPVQNVTMGETVLRELGAQGWEFAAVQTNLAPRVRKAEADLRAGDFTDAYYFFKRAK